MIMVKTPFRMSFFGGGTDMPDYFKDQKGAVISTTFDKYCYITVRHLPRFFDYRDSIVYSKIERAKKISDIEHPLVREAMKFLDMHELSINYDADLPARTGLGTSSSFAVGLLLAFHALKGKYVDKTRLAKEAIYLERTLCNEAGGWQDQVATSFGGLNRIDFIDGDFEVSPIVIDPLRKKKFNDELMMFFTGFSRLSSEIQKDTSNNIKGKIADLGNIYYLVDEAQQILTNKESDLDEIGRLLDYSWKVKRGLGNRISTESIDSIYADAIEAGAIGGKLLGAGGGGFLLFYVPKEKQPAVRKKLSRLLEIPFEFEETGAQVLYFKSEDYELPTEYVD